VVAIPELAPLDPARLDWQSRRGALQRPKSPATATGFWGTTVVAVMPRPPTVRQPDTCRQSLSHFTLLGVDLQWWMPILGGVTAVYAFWLGWKLIRVVAHASH
jgi:hypothetical protein